MICGEVCFFKAQMENLVLHHFCLFFVKHGNGFKIKGKRPLTESQFSIFVISKKFHLASPCLRFV